MKWILSEVLFEKIRETNLFTEETSLFSDEHPQFKLKVSNKYYYLDFIINKYGVIHNIIWKETVIAPPYAFDKDITFEQVFENCPLEIQMELIFHLDVFRHT